MLMGVFPYSPLFPYQCCVWNQTPLFSNAAGQPLSGACQKAMKEAGVVEYRQQTGNIVLWFKGSFSLTGKKLKDNSCFEGEACVAQENTKYVVHSMVSLLEQAVPVRGQEGLRTRGSEPGTKVPFKSLALCFLGTEKLACEFLSQDDAGW